ncbi:MAG: hypothetical protein HQM16_08735 [Deltaproteobacteria bacterium]|nr:hypothetical protein [Deltaproteobacteria bacterium]
MLRDKNIYLFIVLTIFFFLTRFYHYDQFPPANDEAFIVDYTVSVATDFEQYKFFSYTANNQFKPPLQYWLGSVFLTGQTENPFNRCRLFLIVFSTIVFLILLLFLKSQYTMRSALIFAVLYLFSFLSLFYQRLFLNEGFILNLVILYYASCHLFFYAKQNRWLWFVSAIIFGTSLILVKVSGKAFFIIPPVLLVTSTMGGFTFSDGRKLFDLKLLKNTLLTLMIVITPFLLFKLILPADMILEASKDPLIKKWSFSVADPAFWDWHRFFDFAVFVKRIALTHVQTAGSLYTFFLATLTIAATVLMVIKRHFTKSTFIPLLIFLSTLLPTMLFFKGLFKARFYLPYSIFLLLAFAIFIDVAIDWLWKRKWKVPAIIFCLLLLFSIFEKAPMAYRYYNVEIDHPDFCPDVLCRDMVTHGQSLNVWPTVDCLKKLEPGLLFHDSFLGIPANAIHALQPYMFKHLELMGLGETNSIKLMQYSTDAIKKYYKDKKGYQHLYLLIEHGVWPSGRTQWKERLMSSPLCQNQIDIKHGYKISTLSKNVLCTVF